ncbi:hypothetical protein [Chitinimonas lacunae]|uniref:Outer membrane protein beta-barrel domain-containing protein n=1 Tax=Chitinimonas lacunae TaxID=1963018 RepID=A0ABV8MSR5_9NEIS
MRFNLLQSTLIAATMVLGNAALADTTSEKVEQPQAESGLDFLLTLGLTAGGDKLGNMIYTNGKSSSVHAGGMVQLGAGLYWRAKDMPLSVKVTGNYHVDGATASNGDLTFRRFPIEFVGAYHFNERWSLGTGPRLVKKPKLSLSLDGQGGSGEFDDTVGWIVEGAYNFSPKAGFVVRYVKEEYETKGYRPLKFDGSHIGLMLDMRF